MKYTPKKVFILEDGKYIEMPYEEFNRRRQEDESCREKRFLSLHGMLMEVTEEALAARGIRYLFCTAHPENTYSQNNIRSLGYEAFLQKDMYGGYRRDLFIKCI